MVLGAGAGQMLAGVARPGLGRGLVDDVRDSLRELLWYARLEGGRFRFTTEPNLNKVILEREGAIDDDRVVALLYQTLAQVAPGTPEMRVVTRVVESVDFPDESRLTLGILDFDHRIAPSETDDTLRHAENVLLYRGSVGRTNKNSAMLVVADGPALVRARNSARTLAAVDDVISDRPRYSRLNQEQRDELDKRRDATAERLPDHVAMAFRHLLMLAPAQGGGQGLRLEHLDLGPASVGTRIDQRVIDHLLAADRLVKTNLAPAALMTERFSVFPADKDAISVEDLRAYFSRHPHLPKLASDAVLRSCIASGVRSGVFGIALGAAWNAPESVLRFGVDIAADEVQFQAGVYLVKPTAIREEIKKRGDSGVEGIAVTTGDETSDDDGLTNGAGTGSSTPEETSGGSTAGDGAGQKKGLGSVRLKLAGVPADRARDVIKVAILPLAASGARVTVTLEIHAESAERSIPRQTLDLTVLEGLRQLGLTVEVHAE